MAEEADESQKTEEPTSKKLEDARRKGDAPRSQEFNAVFALLTGTLLIALAAGPLASSLSGSLVRFLETGHEWIVTPQTIRMLAVDLALTLLVIVALPFAAFVVAALAANFVQVKPVFTGEKIKPDLKKLDPIKGFGRVFGLQGLMNFAKGVAKIAIICGVTYIVLWPDRDVVMRVPTLEPVVLFAILKGLALKLLTAVCAILVLVALADYLFQRFQFMKKMRMTKQEVKDEHKQTEGDPHVKMKIRQLRMERGRKRMIAAVPEASVVVTNPTHFAVALKYERGQMAAPLCVAKGADLVAKRIREVAQENDVPLVENPPLARALYASVEIDQEIPAEHYAAVAKVIGYVMRLRRTRR